MDISTRIASHFIKAANHYKNSDFSIPQIVSITFYLKQAYMTQILICIFKQNINYMLHSKSFKGDYENKFKIKIYNIK